MTQKTFTLSLNPEIVARAKKIAGLVPFSRYVENLIVLNIRQVESFSERLEDKK